MNNRKRHNFKNLKIWKESIKLVSDTYELTRTFPKFEIYNLSNQLNRCSVSIPSNISEGTSKSSDKHLNKYLEDSLGSAFEWETQLIVAFNENYLDVDKFKELEGKIIKIQRMISGFQETLDI
jgi:four helix bundle protein